jgi:stearoyl-CoA desaturase (delta-9 desaturase)
MGRRPSQAPRLHGSGGRSSSPRLHGFWHVQFLNVYYYMREARNPQTIERFAPDLLPDRLDRAVFSRGWVGLGLGTTLLCLVLGVWPGLLVALAHAVLYVFVLAPLINGLGHWRGARNFDNSAYNSRLLAWVTGGESLHNNHHAHPRSPRFSVRRMEFDPSWLVIRALGAVRLVVITGPPATLPASTPHRQGSDHRDVAGPSPRARGRLAAATTVSRK